MNNVGGYRIDLEDQDFLLASATPATYAAYGDIPERVDPRKSELWSQNWLKVENQGQIGSCQGQSLTECGEYCYTVATGKVIQLSRMFAYLASQKYDNINSDSGSTLSGGTKAFKEMGICLESTGPYTSRYPGRGWITQAMVDEAQRYKMLSHTTMRAAEEIRDFIGSGIGIVQIGIGWGNDMQPDGNGCIRSFSGSGGGGHAVTFTGYVPDSDVGQRSSAGWWALLKNSWGTQWGRGGFAFVDPRAIDQMLKHRFTVMYGRSEMNTPEPRPVPIDWTKPENSMIA